MQPLGSRDMNASSSTPSSAAGAAQHAKPQPQHASTATLPVFDLAELLALPAGSGAPPPALAAQCQQLADCLARTGCLVVRDPRVPASANDGFIDLMEAYFGGRSEQDKARDVRPEVSYQVGATPEGIEVPRCVTDPAGCEAELAQLAPEHRPTLPSGPDKKWRFFWRIGQRPASTAYPELNAAQVVPQGLPQWREVMDSWGGRLLAAVQAVARGAALGFGLDEGAFTSRMAGGPHLLAPTGSDLAAHGAVGDVLAGWHSDLNFITIHGRSRFPGLSVWLADGTRLPVSIPPGCLLCQAGKQLEWLTGGHVKAGMHEVVVTDATVAAVDAARAAGRSLWRVSSTLFSHIASDEVLAPLGPFAAAEGAAAYPPTPAGRQVEMELEAIQLKT